jgi:hypothetical protein
MKSKILLTLCVALISTFTQTRQVHAYSQNPSVNNSRVVNTLNQLVPPAFLPPVLRQQQSSPAPQSNPPSTQQNRGRIVNLEVDDRFGRNYIEIEFDRNIGNNLNVIVTDSHGNVVPSSIRKVRRDEVYVWVDLNHGNYYAVTITSDNISTSMPFIADRRIYTRQDRNGNAFRVPAL